mgnify:CR=1 FL=1
MSLAHVMAFPEGKVQVGFNEISGALHFYQINQSALVNNIKYFSHVIKFWEWTHLKSVDNSEFNWQNIPSTV